MNCMRKRLLWVSCVLALVASACGHGRPQAGPTSTTDPPSTEATTTTAAPTTTSSIVVDPVTPPPTIDLAYVNAVMVQLNAFQAKTTELVLQEGRVGSEAQRRARAVYSGQQLGLAYEEMATIELSTEVKGLRRVFCWLMLGPGRAVPRSVLRLLFGSARSAAGAGGW